MRSHRKKHFRKDGTFVEEIIPRNKMIYPPGEYPCSFCGKVFLVRTYFGAVTVKEHLLILLTKGVVCRGVEKQDLSEQSPPVSR